MPWAYDTPETESVTYDAIRVEAFEVLEINSPAPRLKVTYDRGEWDGATFTILEEAQLVEIQTATVLALMTGLTNDGESLYDAIKRGVYDALNTDGITPPGQLE